MPTNEEARAGLAAKVSAVLGAHLVGYVEVDVPNTSGTAAAIGRMQTGKVAQEILVNMWEDCGASFTHDQGHNGAQICLLQLEGSVPKA